MLISPDLSEAAESTSEPIPPGVYKVRIEDVELKNAKSGANYLRWKTRIFGAEGELARFNNWPVFYNTMTSGKGAGMLKNLYRSATGEDLTGQFDATTLYAKEVLFTLARGKNQDGSPTDWPEVKAVKPVQD